MVSQEILNQYLEFSTNVRKLAKKTVDEYIRVLKSFREFDLLKASGPSEIDEAIIKLSKENEWDHRYEYKYSVVLKTFYKWAEYRQVTPKNLYPYSKIRKPKDKSADFLTQFEFDLIQANDIFLSHQDKTMIHLLWDTGLRRSEMAALDVTDVNFSENILFLPAEKSKGGYGERYLSISDKTADLLKIQIHVIKKPFIFIGCNYERICPSEISERFSYIGNYLLPRKTKLTPHMFRHSLAIRLLDAGATDLEVIKTLGHASVSQTIIYTHSTKKHAKIVREKYLQPA